MSKPTLTISAICPTCGGGGGDWSEDGNLPLTYGVECKSCKGDGTIRQAVNCAGCNHADATHPWSPDKRIWCFEHDREFPADFGCLSWQAREGA